jgi:predicted DsbA family dithiol-disulfide isomerase
MLEAKYGVDHRRIFQRVESAAREAGIPLDLSKQRHTYSTLAAHTLLRHAGARGTQK